MTARSSLEPWSGQQSIGRKASAFFDQHEAPPIARQVYNHLLLNYFIDESSRVTATAQTLAYEMGYQDRKTVYPGSRWLIKNGVMKEERRVIGRGGYVEMSFVVPEKWPCHDSQKRPYFGHIRGQSVRDTPESRP